jgi:hypothetical protein
MQPSIHKHGQICSSSVIVAQFRLATRSKNVQVINLAGGIYEILFTTTASSYRNYKTFHRVSRHQETQNAAAASTSQRPPMLQPIKHITLWLPASSDHKQKLEKAYLFVQNSMQVMFRFCKTQLHSTGPKHHTDQVISRPNSHLNKYNQMQSRLIQNK